MSDPEDLLVEGYAALARSDIDAWLAGFQPDAELHELAEAPDTAVYRDHAEMRQWAATAMELVTEWGWTPEEIIPGPGGSQLVRLRFRAVGRGSSVPIEQEVWHVFTFRDDKVASVRGFLNEDTAREASGETT
jgi:ketosteroid isomerase-like protein